SGMLCDIFTGTTNVAQYFKQRNFSIVSNDINRCCYPLQMSYISNNSFPKFDKLLKKIGEQKSKFNYEEIEDMKNYILKKIKKDKIFPEGYIDELNFLENITPLIKVLIYLNNLPMDNLRKEELFFYNYYTKFGNKSKYESSRGTVGKRNYFNEYNAKKIGQILNKLKKWYLRKNLINKYEFNILLTSLIEEVNLVANVNGTFHDFNRKKLYPNAKVNMKLKPIKLNITPVSSKTYKVFCEDSNKLGKRKTLKDLYPIDILYIDPPYNFRQYSDYYHLINLIAKFHEIEDLEDYGDSLKYVRGQNMKDSIKSDYCYKDKFKDALKDLIKSIDAKHIILSYYDENNHWNHGKNEISYKGRKVIKNIFREMNDIKSFDKEPYKIDRQNYQSRNGHKKKIVDELLFYAKKRR
ncbi:MAG: DNA adenine methylase, partial [archaeon]